MNPLRIIARPLLAAGFIAGGLDQLLDTPQHAEAAEDLVHTLSSKVESIPNDPPLLVRTNGAVMVAAGMALAVGKLPRFAALALSATMVPTTMTQHRFWAETDPTIAGLKRQLFVKNVALLGGALLATAGVNSKHLERKAARKAAVKATKLAAENAQLKVTHAAEKASRRTLG